eukprot:g3612.t1
MYYYCGADGSVFGPYTFSQIGCWVADGSLPGATTYVQHVDAEQGEEWVSYDEACAGVGAEAAASYYDDNSAIAEQAEVVENEGSGWSERVTGAGLVGNLDEALHQDQWADLQWHYLDDTGAIQGPYNTETIGEWFKAGALGLERFVSIDGADWVKLAESAPFLALWSNNAEIDASSGTGASVDEDARALASETSLNDNTTSTAAPKKRRQSILLAAKRCHERRRSLVGASVPAKEQSELAKKLTSQRSIHRRHVSEFSEDDEDSDDDWLSD